MAYVAYTGLRVDPPSFLPNSPHPIRVGSAPRFNFRARNSGAIERQLFPKEEIFSDQGRLVTPLERIEGLVHGELLNWAKIRCF